MITVDRALTIASATWPPGTSLRLLVLFRAIAILGQTTAVVLAAGPLDMAVPLGALAAGIALLATVNLSTWAWLRRGGAVQQAMLLPQFLVDVAVLTWLLYHTGGVHNPFAEMYLLPLAVAAAAMPWRQVTLLAAVSIGCYTGLTLYHLPLPAPAAFIESGTLIATGRWLSYAISAALIAFFVMRHAHGVREHERLLGEARARALDHACAKQVGSLAAGTAHEMGSPLAVIAVLLQELRHQYREVPELVQSLDLMSGGVDACRESLERLREVAENPLRSGRLMPLDAFLDNITDQFKMLRPEVELHVARSGGSRGPTVAAETTLEQALLALLDNAADVSTRDVAFESHWDDQELVVRVLDRGPGLSMEASRRVAGLLTSAKAPRGEQGLGLYLAGATVGRLGGRLVIQARPDGGTCAEIRVPLSALEAR